MKDLPKGYNKIWYKQKTDPKFTITPSMVITIINRNKDIPKQIAKLESNIDFEMWVERDERIHPDIREHIKANIDDSGYLKLENHLLTVKRGMESGRINANKVSSWFTNNIKRLGL